MPLHPQVQTVLAAAPPREAVTDESLPRLRALLRAQAAAVSGPGTEVATVTDVDAGGVPVRLYLPGESGEAGAPVVVYLHGGGWVNGDLDTYDAVCRYLAALSGAAVAAVGYRLAPEHPYPAAFEDIDNAVLWLRGKGATEHGLDPHRIAVVGDSAGGHLAAVTARRWRDVGAGFTSQVLVYPVIDPTADRSAAAVPGLPEELRAVQVADGRFCWDSFAPEGFDRGHPDLSPLAADLAGLPPALVITAEYDLLRPEGEAYAHALAEAGVPTVSVCYQGQAHDFFRGLVLFDAARAAIAQVAATLRAELA
ncbi:alpha/beta hydrolase [Actinokineospora sp. PR83]|uniref:alpha/beta hydrolase n=1 Tax=Actinokineospora sp. PR83 TaxID=2884908 RepID=UPI0027E0CA0A|nr:alpha/beta hydrolase [Actinokineospora sp. PR83]MCG8914366.1 alpha/beta hydrolase [Actinokineospora sp. PR83]